VIALATGIMLVIKSVIGTDEPQKAKIKHATPHIKINGKTDSARLRDLGL